MVEPCYNRRHSHSIWRSLISGPFAWFHHRSWSDLGYWVSPVTVSQWSTLNPVSFSFVCVSKLRYIEVSPGWNQIDTSAIFIATPNLISCGISTDASVLVWYNHNLHTILIPFSQVLIYKYYSTMQLIYLSIFKVFWGWNYLHFTDPDRA